MSLEIPARVYEATPAARGATTETAAPEAPSPSAFADALSRLGSELDRGEVLVQRAAHGGMGGQTSAADLIAIQAGIYRYTEAVDLAAKVVDRLSSSIKTVMQAPS